MKKLNYDTIKKFTGEGRYTVSTPLKYFADSIENYIKEYGLQLNPDFQRGHVWTEQQQIAFVEYILRGGKMQPIRFNHEGWMNSFKGEMVCVDGLQRVTALMKFLKNDLGVFGGHLMSDIENLPALSIDIPITVNDLKTRKEVLQWYIELNDGGTPHTTEEINKVKQLLKKA